MSSFLAPYAGDWPVFASAVRAAYLNITREYHGTPELSERLHELHCLFMASFRRHASERHGELIVGRREVLWRFKPGDPSQDRPMIEQWVGLIDRTLTDRLDDLGDSAIMTFLPSRAITILREWECIGRIYRATPPITIMPNAFLHAFCRPGLRGAYEIELYIGDESLEQWLETEWRPFAGRVPFFPETLRLIRDELTAAARVLAHPSPLSEQRPFAIRDDDPVLRT
jgi:hypothetical protein